MSQDTEYKQYVIREYSPSDPDYPGRPFQGFSQTGGSLTLPQNSADEVKRLLDAQSNPDDHAKY
ncbi:hypothetical protein [Pseudomonas brassicacearum]|uniref:hypothetical protein n=1 Tax=Pseudomonas brassicacearum TaxID=930166 RepID=UPI0011840242|nr:hypothetical protein [Pseudomonas brassicacearum]